MPAGKPAALPLCYIGCFASYGWEGCTIDNSRPPGSKSCLYVTGERMAFDEDDPLLRRCAAECQKRSHGNPWTYYGLNDGTACYCGRGAVLEHGRLDDTHCAVCPDLPGMHCTSLGQGDTNRTPPRLLAFHHFIANDAQCDYEIIRQYGSVRDRCSVSASSGVGMADDHIPFARGSTLRSNWGAAWQAYQWEIGP
eukprot:SAG31_NODE_17288_length_676_cov_1.512998_1_plen_194_part_10